MAPEARRDFYAHMDAANIDLKAFTDDFYHRICFAHLDPVLDTLRWIRHESDVWLEVTTLLIPGKNDSEDDLAQLCEWFAKEIGTEVPLHFTAFHPSFKMMDVPATPAPTLSRARQQGIAAGLKHVYTGNIRDAHGQSTYCAKCGEKVIGRDGYQITDWRLSSEGRCRECRQQLAGHFAAEPGHWGSRRQPIALFEEAGA
jgi:pyruvate formate lyase activating enzyme